MASRYFVETYNPDGARDGFHEEFEEFQAAFNAAKNKKLLQPDRVVRFHLPASASEEERQQVRESGWELI